MSVIGDTAPMARPAGLKRRRRRPMIRAMRAGAYPADDCPPARPGRRTTHARALHLACVVLGGVSQLAAHLAVPQAAVRGWIEGADEPPQAIFLAAVDLILLDAEKRARSAS